MTAKEYLNQAREIDALIHSKLREMCIRDRCGCSAASYLRVCGQRSRKRKRKAFQCGILRRN